MTTLLLLHLVLVPVCVFIGMYSFRTADSARPILGPQTHLVVLGWVNYALATVNLAFVVVRLSA